MCVFTEPSRSRGDSGPPGGPRVWRAPLDAPQARGDIPCTRGAPLCSAAPGPIQAPMRCAHPIRHSFLLSTCGCLKTGQVPDLTHPVLKKIGAHPEYTQTWHSASAHPATCQNLCFFIKKSHKNKISPGPNFFLNRSAPIGTADTKPHV